MSIIETWNGLEIGSEYPIGTIVMYDGTDIGGGDTADINTRTDKISVDNGDGIDYGQGDWYVCNGDGDGGAVPDLIGLFIRGEETSGNEDGDDNAIVVSHTHAGATNADGAHSHTFNDTDGNHTHKMKITSTLYVCRVYSCNTSFYGIAYKQDGRGLRYMDDSPSHTHTITDYDSHDHDDVTNASGSAAANANKPHYYDVIFVIKMA